MNVAQTIKTYNENSDLSIRCLNYFVVNYAKAEHVVLGQKKNLYHEYQAKLKRSKRINFDPFNRGQKCVFHGVHTSKAQIEFFTWALAFNVLEYFQNHYETIYRHMSTQIQRHRQGAREKREYLCELNDQNVVSIVDTDTFYDLFIDKDCACCIKLENMGDSLI